MVKKIKLTPVRQTPGFKTWCVSIDGKNVGDLFESQGMVKSILMASYDTDHISNFLCNMAFNDMLDAEMIEFKDDTDPSDWLGIPTMDDDLKEAITSIARDMKPMFSKPVCTCGARHTSNPNHHMRNVCDLAK